MEKADMKLCGMLMSLLACAALGIEAGNMLRLRYHSFQELKMLVGLLKGELQYGAATLDLVFDHLAKQSGTAFASFFGETAREIKKVTGETLESILQKNAQQYLTSTGLNRKEQERLTGICTQLTLLDRLSQITLLEGYGYELQKAEEIALEKAKQKETMYRCLGIMGGLFLVILFF